MKKAFTLVELMVVVLVIVILLSITLKLVGTGSEASKRNTTIARMQRLENCLSGYFAAFGSYPPVELHASRNVYAELDSDGVQDPGSETGNLVWQSVEVACRAQPVGASYPFRDGYTEYIEEVSKTIVKRLNSNDPRFAHYRNFAQKFGGGFEALHDPSQVGAQWRTATTWEEVKIFKFGLMSFLLPRYMFMTRGVNPQDLEDCAQWNVNNRLASHPNTGSSFNTWEEQLKDARLVRRIPSQAVCARWMPNLEGIVSGNSLRPDRNNPNDNGMTFFGIDLAPKGGGPALSPDNVDYEVYVHQGRRLVLDGMTVCDGWGKEFFYYSQPPFQSYQLWSSGANGLTFPPWMPFSALKSNSDRETAANWMADDIMYLSN